MSAATIALAARRIVAVGLAPLRRQRDAVLASDDPEAVHDFRVALRRIRSALRVHRKGLEPAFEARVAPGLRWIAARAGAVRDLDVLATDTLPAIEGRLGASPGRAFVRRLEYERALRRDSLRRALASRRYAKLIADLEGWAGSPESAPKPRRLRAFAARVLQRQHRRVVRVARRPEAATPRGRHRVRIEAKRLRYALQGYASIFTGRDAARYEKRLGEMQEDLGRANDAVVARRCLARLKPGAKFMAHARRVLAAQEGEGRDALDRRLAALERAPRPWK